MNHIKNKGIHIHKTNVITNNTNHNDIVVSLKIVAIQIMLRISIINQIILNRIPTVATVFFCLF